MGERNTWNLPRVHMLSRSTRGYHLHETTACSSRLHPTASSSDNSKGP